MGKNDEKIIDGAGEVIGSAAGAAFGLAFAGPLGAIGGAALTPVFSKIVSWCATEFKEKHYSSREQKNIANVISNAAADCKQSVDSDSEAFDEDWFARYVDIVKNISSEDMQIIWGKILAGEIASPKSFSLRMLETIRNISIEEAQKFQKIIPLIMHSGNTYFVLSDNDILNKFGLAFSDIMVLNECGLMDSSGTLSLNLYISKDKPEYLLSDTLIIVLKGKQDGSKKISIRIHTLTRAGLELFNILAHEVNEEYMIEVANFVFSKNKETVNTSVHRLVSLERDLEGEKFKYTTMPVASYSK